MVDRFIKTRPISGPSNEAQLADQLNRSNGSLPFLERLRIAQIINIDKAAQTLHLDILDDKTTRVVPYFGFFSNPTAGTGLWHGFSKGDFVLCAIGASNNYIILNKLGSGVSEFQKTGISNDGVSDLFYDSLFASKDKDLENLPDGGFLLKCDKNIQLKLYPEEGALLGNRGHSSIFFDTTDVNNALGGSTTLETNQNYCFTFAGYSLDGILLRDTRKSDINADNDADINERLITQWYKNLSAINFDPTLKMMEETRANGGVRNPNFVEKRNITYEFADYTFDNPIQSDEKESKKQDLKSTKTLVNKTNSRRIRSGDVFSLSLVSPNYLIEEIAGTAADVYGNLLDLNRTILPIGNDDGFISLQGSTDSYLKVRELHRKNIAFHWELNARKDPTELDIESGSGNEYAFIEGIYKRNRSRMFLDIDKEGQFKLNVPASSEKGNVSVLARYENITTINPYEESDKKDYDYFNRTADNKTDILLDAFGNGVVNLVGNDKALPKDRTNGSVIKVGTAFHDISTTCVVPLPTDNPKNPRGILSGPDTEITDVDKTTRNILQHTGGASVVTKEIKIDGDDANAGGRSGTLVFDGMMNTSIGANTVDRQSLWLDTAGGVISRLGADLNGISLATQTDGDVYLQIGGQVLGPDTGVDPDKRFKDSVVDTGNTTKRFEIRVMQGNGPSFARILIDNEGILICGPKNIELRAEEDLVLTAGGNVLINGEKIIPYSHTIADDSLRLTRQSKKFEDVYTPDPGARPITRGLDKFGM
jgi:hypothetical protein